jgi:hypothetical protein
MNVGFAGWLLGVGDIGEIESENRASVAKLADPACVTSSDLNARIGFPSAVFLMVFPAGLGLGLGLGLRLGLGE